MSLAAARQRAIDELAAGLVDAAAHIHEKNYGFGEVPLGPEHWLRWGKVKGHWQLLVRCKDWEDLRTVASVSVALRVQAANALPALLADSRARADEQYREIQGAIEAVRSFIRDNPLPEAPQGPDTKQRSET